MEAARWVFVFFVCLAQFIDLLTDKVQPLSRQRKFQTEMDAGIVLINTVNQRKMSPVKLPQRLSERVEALTLKFGYDGAEKEKRVEENRQRRLNEIRTKAKAGGKCSGGWVVGGVLLGCLLSVVCCLFCLFKKKKNPVQKYMFHKIDLFSLLWFYVLLHVLLSIHTAIRAQAAKERRQQMARQQQLARIQNPAAAAAAAAEHHEEAEFFGEEGDGCAKKTRKSCTVC